MGDEALVDEGVIDEESAVVAQQGGDDAVFVGFQFSEPVQLVTGEEEHDAGLVLLFLDVIDVAGTVQNLQRGVYLNGEMVELATEVIDVELEGGVVA